ncbi:aerobic-type carbon monoxide dehydrogenase small subunit (CoxS/CutS family) [Streptomyces sp. SAI-117]|uniref:2Fe-2S iron-sulfur cluster-binding protein n=1 Tax=Streptomyces sp. SAI-117 TaxID=2940546 RepID=UPI002475FB59|nr:2Fe-2S iron-sulfur cluster-binding protein [Streptomyces sp. SAI-117]MDH6570008.1 aerobic-type carbon monoxide dehydrogenase small subunit (CoxS/CutS family) [Streptomyces sp. SAI-117]
MTDDQHGEGTPRAAGRWDPLPQGDYDDGATAFVKLPEGGIDALLASTDSPLAAPGHGYVPPQITAAQGDGTDPGAWTVPPAESAQWPDPSTLPQGQTGQFTYNPATTQQWHVEDTAAAPAPGHDVTGQWSIPVAGGDLPDESGEFTTSSLVEQWGGTPPATLPGGAAAPWATQPAQPWGDQPRGEPGAGPEHGGPAGERHPHVPHGDGHGSGFDGGREGGFPGGHEGGFDDGRGDGFDDGHGGAAGGGHVGPPGDRHAGPAGDGHAHVPAGEMPGGGADEAIERHGGPAGDAHLASAAHPGDHAVADAPQRPGPDEESHELSQEAAQPHADTDGRGTGLAEPSAAASQPSPGPGETSAAPRLPESPEEALEGADGPAEPGAEHPPTAGEGEPAPETVEEPAPDADEDPDDQALAHPGEEHPLAAYVLRVNGVDRPVTDAWIGESLLYVLRERLGLAGAKDGCSQGECGACNVQVDGRLVASCLVPAVTAAGSEVRTVEGLAEDGRPSDVQRALARCGAVQCGFCVPGMAMTVHDLLEGNPAPTELETRQALCGNLCRCSGYRGVVDAVKEVVAEREAHAAADAETDGDEARIPHQAGPGAGGVNPSAFDSPGFPGTSGPHEQAYGQGQDGGQA